MAGPEQTATLVLHGALTPAGVCMVIKVDKVGGGVIPVHIETHLGRRQCHPNESMMQPNCSFCCQWGVTSTAGEKWGDDPEDTLTALEI